MVHESLRKSLRYSNSMIHEKKSFRLVVITAFIILLLGISIQLIVKRSITNTPRASANMIPLCTQSSSFGSTIASLTPCGKDRMCAIQGTYINMYTIISEVPKLTNRIQIGDTIQSGETDKIHYFEKDSKQYLAYLDNGNLHIADISDGKAAQQIKVEISSEQEEAGIFRHIRISNDLLFSTEKLIESDVEYFKIYSWSINRNVFTPKLLSSLPLQTPNGFNSWDAFVVGGGYAFLQSSNYTHGFTLVGIDFKDPSHPRIGHFQEFLDNQTVDHTVYSILELNPNTHELYLIQSTAPRLQSSNIHIETYDVSNYDAIRPKVEKRISLGEVFARNVKALSNNKLLVFGPYESLLIDLSNKKTTILSDALGTLSALSYKNAFFISTVNGLLTYTSVINSPDPVQKTPQQIVSNIGLLAQDGSYMYTLGADRYFNFMTKYPTTKQMSLQTSSIRDPHTIIATLPLNLKDVIDYEGFTGIYTDTTLKMLYITTGYRIIGIDNHDISKQKQLFDMRLGTGSSTWSPISIANGYLYMLETASNLAADRTKGTLVIYDLKQSVPKEITRMAIALSASHWSTTVYQPTLNGAVAANMFAAITTEGFVAIDASDIRNPRVSEEVVILPMIDKKYEYFRATGIRGIRNGKVYITGEAYTDVATDELLVVYDVTTKKVAETVPAEEWAALSGEYLYVLTRENRVPIVSAYRELATSRTLIAQCQLPKTFYENRISTNNDGSIIIEGSSWTQLERWNIFDKLTQRTIPLPTRFISPVRN